MPDRPVLNASRDGASDARRTALAWTRTALALAADALLVTRVSMQREDRFLLALGIVLASVAVLLLAVGHRRRGELRAGAAAVPAGRLGWVAAAVVATAAGIVWAAWA
jgi:uncharacterized membrane protein YidH (DUF202 family)